jgi:hypothetical protein
MNISYRHSDNRMHRGAAEMTMIRAKRLTTFSVAPDGASVAIGVADEDGSEGTVLLPSDCLKELTMTLPEMMRQALRLRHGDPSLRLVYPAAGWAVEQSNRPGIFILTLRTPDGFDVSFAMTANELRDMAGSAADHEAAAMQSPPRLVH